MSSYYSKLPIDASLASQPILSYPMYKPRIKTPSIYASSALLPRPLFPSYSPLRSHRSRPLLHTPHALSRRTHAITIKPRRILPTKLEPEARPTPLPPAPTPADRPLPPRPRRRPPPEPQPTLRPHALGVLRRARRRGAREAES